MVAHAPIKRVAFFLLRFPSSYELLKGRPYLLQIFLEIKAELSLLHPVFNQDAIAERLLHGPKLGEFPMSGQGGTKKYATGH
jgi:hypothetical protein